MYVYIQKRTSETVDDHATGLEDEDFSQELVRIDQMDVAIEETIKWIKVYDGPLTRFQLTKMLLKHTYIVLRTDEHWWSVETRDNVLVMQRSSNLEDVRDKVEGENRLTGIRGTCVFKFSLF